MKNVKRKKTNLTKHISLPSPYTANIFPFKSWCYNSNQTYLLAPSKLIIYQKYKM